MAFLKFCHWTIQYNNHWSSNFLTRKKSSKTTRATCRTWSMWICSNTPQTIGGGVKPAMGASAHLQRIAAKFSPRTCHCSTPVAFDNPFFSNILVGAPTIEIIWYQGNWIKFIETFYHMILLIRFKQIWLYHNYTWSQQSCRRNTASWRATKCLQASWSPQLPSRQQFVVLLCSGLVILDWTKARQPETPWALHVWVPLCW